MSEWKENRDILTVRVSCSVRILFIKRIIAAIGWLCRLARERLWGQEAKQEREEGRMSDRADEWHLQDRAEFESTDVRCLILGQSAGGIPAWSNRSIFRVTCILLLLLWRRRPALQAVLLLLGHLMLVVVVVLYR